MDRSIIARKGYCNLPTGQLHWRCWGGSHRPKSEEEAPALVCLHPAPFSGLAFQNLAPELADSRPVWAPDYPAYGNSEPIEKAQPSIAEYAEAIGSFIDNSIGSDPVDLLGFHTGCLVGAELAILRPEIFRRLVLIDIPASDDDTSADLVARYSQPSYFGPDLSTLAPAWEQVIGKRLETQGMMQALAMLAQQLLAGSHANEAFHAAFSYPWKQRLTKLNTPTLIVASQSPLLEATREAAALISSAKLVERLDITRSVVDEAASITAAVVREFLDQPDNTAND